MFKAKHLAILMAGFLAGFGGATAQTPANGWTPDEQLVAQVDSLARRFKLPKGFGVVSTYQRYYWGIVTVDGRRLVEGFFVSPRTDFVPFGNENGFYSSRPVQVRNRPGEIHIVPENKVPTVKGGGCGYVSIEFEVKSGKLNISCNAPE